MRNYELRGKAREALRGQWGINAAVILVVNLIVYMIGLVVVRITSFSAGTFQNVIIDLLLNFLIIFAFTYGQSYIALDVSRGNRAEIGDIFVIFQKKYYVPMAIFNFIGQLLTFVMSLIVFIPILLIFGLGTYITIATSNVDSLMNIFTSMPVLSTGVVIMVVLALTAISFIFSVIIGGIFQFAAWAKIDNPDMPTMSALKYAWLLLKNRLGQYILLNLSFIGWYLTCILILPIFWVTPYVNVTLATFYNDLKQEKGFPTL